MPTLVLQPPEGDPTNRDTYIADGTFANNNFGSDVVVSVGVQDVGKEAYRLYRALLRFDLTALIGATILDATLILTLSHGSVVNETFGIHRLTQPSWTEFGATWNSYDVGQPWALQGGDYDPMPAQTVLMPTAGNLVFDQLKPLVEDALRYRGGLLDVLIQGASNTGFQILHFLSSVNATPANRPTLVVDFEHNVWCVKTGDAAVYAVSAWDEAC